MKTLPIRHTLTFAYRSSLVVAILIAVVSTAGLLFGSAGLYGPDPKRAMGMTEAEAGLLVPGFLALDAYNFVVGLPILISLLWLTYRGSLIGLLLWPGALFYMAYTYALYLVGAPFSVLFLLGLVIGVAGLMSTAAPVLTELGVAFGLGIIVWWIWLGIVLLRSKPSAAAEADVRRQDDARRATWTPKTP